MNPLGVRFSGRGGWYMYDIIHVAKLQILL